jgi:PIN domain nuclease of toxin-antitoxin system
MMLDRGAPVPFRDIVAADGLITARRRTRRDRRLEPAGFSMLPITGEHAAKVAELPMLHKDPFDRMLVTQASVEPMVLLTTDETLRGYGSFVTVG